MIKYKAFEHIGKYEESIDKIRAKVLSEAGAWILSKRASSLGVFEILGTQWRDDFQSGARRSFTLEILYEDGQL